MRMTAGHTTERKRYWRALVVSSAMSMAATCVVSAVAADTPHKVFTPGAVINPAAYYPEGPQLIEEGLLVAEMGRDRVVLIANSGERKTVWQEQGCGATSVKRIPSGG